MNSTEILIPTVSMILLGASIMFVGYYFVYNNKSQRSFENNFSIVLCISILICYLLFCYSYSLILIAGSVKEYYRELSYYYDGHEVKHDVRRTCFLLSAFLIHFGGIVIPIFALANLRIKYYSMIYSYLRLSKENHQEPHSVHTLQLILNEVKQITKIPYKLHFIIDNDKKESIAGCQIITNVDNLYFIIDAKLVQLFESGKINGDGIKSIILHEIGHIYNKDYFLPTIAKYSIHSIVPVPITGCYLLAFLLFSVCKNGPVAMLWTYFILPGTVIIIASYLIRIIFMQIIARIMRQREYLADARACETAIKPELMIQTIKNIYLYLMPPKVPRNIFSFAYVDFNTVRYPRNWREKVFWFFAGEIIWHPLASDRIKALREAKYIYEENKIETLPPYDVVVLAFTFSLFTLLLGMIFLMNDKANFIIYLTFSLIITPIIPSFISFLPLRFVDDKKLEKALMPNISAFDDSIKSLRLFPFILKDKTWEKIVGASSICVIINWLLILPVLYFTKSFMGIALLFFFPVMLLVSPWACVEAVKLGIKMKIEYRQKNINNQ